MKIWHTKLTHVHFIICEACKVPLTIHDLLEECRSVLRRFEELGIAWRASLALKHFKWSVLVLFISTLRGGAEWVGHYSLIPRHTFSKISSLFMNNEIGLCTSEKHGSNTLDVVDMKSWQVRLTAVRAALMANRLDRQTSIIVEEMIDSVHPRRTSLKDFFFFFF